MNNFKKIGLSALAGSLVAMSAASAGEMTVSGGASVGVSQGKEENASAYYMNDSINFSFSGETDSGLTVTQKIELENGVDNQSTSIAGSFGTLTFHKHGGDSVMSGWDDMTPNAYDEPWGVVASDANTTGTNEVHIINGISGDNLWRYDSPTVNGVSVHAAYKQSATAASEGSGAAINSYTDFGVQIAPDMVEGLTIGYAFGEVEETATVSNDESTLWIKYAMGPLTVGYQTSEVDGQTTTQDDEGTAFGISYAVSDAFSVSYGVNEVDLGSATAAGTDQEAEGISASYTMGGVSISVAMNEVKNAGGSTADDHEAYDLNVAFAF